MNFAENKTPAFLKNARVYYFLMALQLLKGASPLHFNA
jgi:hypothetical protein